VKIPEETPAPVAVDNHQQPAEPTSSGSDQGADKVTTVVNGADAVADTEPRAQSSTTVVRISGTFAAVQVRMSNWCACAHTHTGRASTSTTHGLPIHTIVTANEAHVTVIAQCSLVRAVVTPRIGVMALLSRIVFTPPHSPMTRPNVCETRVYHSD
jgi:hypothetical protein